MSTFDKDCRLKLYNIAKDCPNTEYNSKKFNPVIMRFKYPEITALIFASPKVVVTGIEDEVSSKITARKNVNILNKFIF